MVSLVSSPDSCISGIISSLAVSWLSGTCISGVGSVFGFLSFECFAGLFFNSSPMIVALDCPVLDNPAELDILAGFFARCIQPGVLFSGVVGGRPSGFLLCLMKAGVEYGSSPSVASGDLESRIPGVLAKGFVKVNPGPNSAIYVQKQINVWLQLCSEVDLVDIPLYFLLISRNSMKYWIVWDLFRYHVIDLPRNIWMYVDDVVVDRVELLGVYAKVGYCCVRQGS